MCGSVYTFSDIYYFMEGEVSEDDTITLSSSKLKVNLTHSDDDEIYISRERVASFKEWLDS